MTDTVELRRELEVFARDVAPQLPVPGRGATADRFSVLGDIARRDLSVARLCEAHADALAILADSDRTAPRRAAFGVWAARSRDEVITATRRGDGWRLTGRKPWCTGAGIVSHALLTAESDQGPLLFQVTLDDPGIEVAERPWSAPAFEATDTVTLELDLTVAIDDQVGGPGSYLDRPGFWHGATGVAACWGGGIVGLSERAASWWRRDPHASAHRAAVDAQAWAAPELIAAAGRDADAHPADAPRAHRNALRVRHLIDTAATDALEHVRRGCGPAPFAFSAEFGRHAAELELYIRQCHAERDLEALAQLLTDD